MMYKTEILNSINYLNIILEATKNLKNILIKEIDDIQIMYGEDGFGKYFIQFIIEEYENDNVSLTIAENIDTLYEAFTMSKALSDLYNLEIVEF